MGRPLLGRSHLPADASANVILGAIREWIKLLVEERCENASSQVATRDDWMPELLRLLFENYSFVEPRRDGHRFTMAPIETAVIAPDEGSPSHLDTWT